MDLLVPTQTALIKSTILLGIRVDGGGANEVTCSIMRSVPCLKLRIGDFPKLESLGSAVESDKLLSECVVSPLWQKNCPEVVVYSTDKDAEFLLVQVDATGDIYLHCDSDYCIRSVPEADVASVLASGWWVPGHDEKIKLNADIEDNHGVPSFELGFG